MKIPFGITIILYLIAKRRTRKMTFFLSLLFLSFVGGGGGGGIVCQGFWYFDRYNFGENF